MNIRLPLLMLTALVVTSRLAAAPGCDPLPTLQISDVRTTLTGDSLREDRVIDGTASKDSEPLRFAKVRLYAEKNLVQRTTTDAHGHFLLENLAPGGYTLSFEGMGRFSIEVTAPRFFQQSYYGFSSLHGCLSWGVNTD
jgi:Carboxypeptidase regulatory-like domain